MGQQREGRGEKGRGGKGRGGKGRKGKGRERKRRGGKGRGEKRRGGKGRGKKGREKWRKRREQVNTGHILFPIPFYPLFNEREKERNKKTFAAVLKYCQHNPALAYT